MRDPEGSLLSLTLLPVVLAALGTLLGIHCGNRELYRQQSDLLGNVIRALVSAIDAKDPYTSGHSERVARCAQRWARGA